MSCDRAWALCYIAGIREPESEWNDKTAPPRRRSRAVGKATHAVFEAWQTPGGVPNWRDLPGQIALSGAHHVPHPERVHVARVEAPIGRVPLPPSDKPHAPTVAYELHGVMWAGYRDLLVSAPAEFIRLKIDAPDGWALYDYKTTASIEKYALTPARLAVDPQANLYVAATCDELGLDELPVRWLYLESKKVRRALPVDARIRRDDAKARIEEYAVKARRLDLITSVEDAAMNTGACGEYGGCYYHVSNGGPCNARRSIGALIQARVPKQDRNTMALQGLTPGTKAVFDNFKKNGVTPNAQPAVTESAPEAETETRETIAGPQEMPGAPVALPTGGTGGVTKPRTPRTKTTLMPSGGMAERIATLTAELAQHEAEAAAAAANIARVIASMREALG